MLITSKKPARLLCFVSCCWGGIYRGRIKCRWKQAHAVRPLGSEGLSSAVDLTVSTVFSLVAGTEALVLFSQFCCRFHDLFHDPSVLIGPLIAMKSPVQVPAPQTFLHPGTRFLPSFLL